MADGLLGGMQSQGQQQANLLGGVFQSPSATRRQGRDRLFGRALEISQAQDPIAAGGAIGGAQLGLGIGNALGMQTDEQRRANLLEQVQQETLDRGLDPATDPEGTFNFISNRFRQLGDPQLALQAQQQKAQYLKEFAPEQGDVKTYYGPDGNAVQARVVNNRLLTLNNEDITGQGYGTSSRTPQVSIDQRNRPELSDPQVSTIENAAEAGDQARNIEFTLGAVEDLAVQEDIPQDALQPLITGAQGYADALGLDFEGALSSLGYEGIGDLSGKQELNRLYTDLVIRGFDKFKGNLNDREVRLAQNAQPGIGKSRDANLKAIATQRAAAEIAKRDSRMFLSATTPDEFSSALERRDERSLDEFRELRDTYYEQLKSKSGGTQGQEGGSQEGQNERLRYNPETGRLE